MKSILTKAAVLAGALLTLTATAQQQYQNEFWISTNATGVMYPNPTNGGTLDNPLDGSTEATFDSNMDSLPTNSTVHILAGTYHTFGDNAYAVKTGQKILGSGIDVTVLQLVSYNPNHPDGNYFVHTIGNNKPFQGLVDGPVTNVEVCDLTCDCNYGTGNTTVCGVTLDGTLNAIRRVKVINSYYAGTNTGTSEAWGVECENSSLPTSVGNVIEDCEVSQFAGGSFITAISLNGVSGTIRNNRVFLPPGLGDAMGGTRDVLIEGNYVDGSGTGVYCDTGGCTNLMVVHNTIRNTFSGVTLDVVNAGEKNITIAFNNFDQTNSSPEGTPGNPVFNFWGGTLTNVFIFGNTITSSGSSPSTSFLVAAYDLTGLEIANNTIDPQIASNQVDWGTAMYITTNVVNMNIDNNYDLYGNYLYNLNMPTIGGVTVSPFGLALVNSAEASSALTNLGLPSNPANVVTNNESGVTLSGTFSGDGSGLTNINASPLTPICFGTIYFTGFNGTAYLTNSVGCTITSLGLLNYINFTGRIAANNRYIVLGDTPVTSTATNRMVLGFGAYTNGASFAVFSQ